MKTLIHFLFAAAFAAIGLNAPAQPYTFTTIAGFSGVGFTDGTGNAARFNNPWGIGSDPSGDIFVADTENCCIRRITPSGVVTTLAGKAQSAGYADGAGSAARFAYPTALAVDDLTNIYVVDFENNVVRMITPDGVASTLAGVPGVAGTNDGPALGATFNYSYGIAADGAGNVYVADSGNATIRLISGGMVTTYAGTPGASGFSDGTGPAARFSNPAGIVADGSGNLYVADDGNGCIRKIAPGGVVTTLAGTYLDNGSRNGPGSLAEFNNPYDVAVNSSGTLYVADDLNSLIRAIDTNNVVSTLAGGAQTVGDIDASGTAARFNGPLGVTVDPSGNIYVADSGNNIIRKITPDGAVTTFAGGGGSLGSADGPGNLARFYQPGAVAPDGAGNLFIADSGNNTIRKITADGGVQTFAGLAGANGINNGTGSAARFNEPNGIIVDGAGNVYVGDSYGGSVRKITPGAVVTALARGMEFPQGVALDPATNIYVADSQANLIKKISPRGTITLLPGETAAQFNWPSGVAVDSATNVYVADYNSDTIRKITPGGVVTTFAGMTGQAGGTDGLGPAARFSQPGYIVIDAVGNLYVADSGGNRIRKITPAGMVTTLGGSGVFGYADGTGPAAEFAHPYGVGVDGYGNVYVADTYNNAIRKGTPPPPSLQISVADGGAMLTWPYYPPGYSLEYTTNLASGAWSQVANLVTITNGENNATDTTGGSARYYRLKQN